MDKNMDTALLVLAMISSVAAIFYILRGLYMIYKEKNNYAQLEPLEKNRIARIRIYDLYPDHIMFTPYLMALSVALGMNSWLFIIIGAYFIAIKMTKVFHLLSYEKAYPIYMRNIGTLAIMLPMTALAVYCFYRVLYFIV